jgi:hypothetical protein
MKINLFLVTLVIGISILASLALPVFSKQANPGFLGFANGSNKYLISTEGITWKYDIDKKIWVDTAIVLPTIPGNSTPISYDQISQWSYFIILDKSGNVWGLNDIGQEAGETPFWEYLGKPVLP